MAAASLIGQFSASEEAISILKAARKSSGGQGMGAQIGVALCQALEKAKNSLFAGEAFDFRVKARTGLKQWKELEQDALTQ